MSQHTVIRDPAGPAGRHRNTAASGGDFNL